MMLCAETDSLPASLDEVALLLDFDGTLVDIAATPDAVRVPGSLRDDLMRLSGRLAGALAVVSGRSLESLDALLAPLRLAAAGEHGAVIRAAPDAAPVRPDLPALPAGWRDAAAGWAAAHPGVVLEEKHAGFVLHYRLAPALGPELHRKLGALLGATTTHEILPAACAWEVRPRGIDKGRAVRCLMRGAAFRGRLPVYVGDDVTDEDAIAAASALGGAGLRVAERFGDAAGVRAWIARLAA